MRRDELAGAVTKLTSSRFSFLREALPLGPPTHSAWAPVVCSWYLYLFTSPPQSQRPGLNCEAWLFTHINLPWLLTQGQGLADVNTGEGQQMNGYLEAQEQWDQVRVHLKTKITIPWDTVSSSSLSLFPRLCDLVSISESQPLWLVCLLFFLPGRQAQVLCLPAFSSYWVSVPLSLWVFLWHISGAVATLGWTQGTLFGNK